jgi:C1A family cysteine protease
MNRGLGWHPSLPDFRDYSPDTPAVRALLSHLRPGPWTLPKKATLADFFPETDDQQQLPASTAQACVDLVRYFDRRATGRMSALSKLFVYQAGRQLRGDPAGQSLDFRSTWKAIVAFGIPNERHWPYRWKTPHKEPPAFLFQIGNRYRSVLYVRVDGRNSTGHDTLLRLKVLLNAGFPCVFGLPVPDSISNAADVPYRPIFNGVQGGQALVAVGYDNERLAGGKGALQFRNSWGRNWGEEGYGWLPYAYIEEQLAIEFWTLVGAEWLESDEFLRPALFGAAHEQK